MKAIKPPVLRGRRGQQVAKIRKLLLSKELELIELGVTLARDLDDEDVFEALLGGVGVTRVAHKPPIHEWIPNTVFEHGHQVRPWRLHALRNLVAVASPRYHPLREKVRGISLSGRLGTRGPKVPIDLRRLRRYPNLQHLHVSEAKVLHGCDELEHMVSLKLLNLQANEYSSVPLSLPPSLERVELHAYPGRQDVIGGLGWEQLESLYFTYTDPSAAGLARLVSCRRISLRDVGLDDEGVAALGRLPALEELRLHAWPLETSLHALSRSTSLRRLALGELIDLKTCPNPPGLKGLYVSALESLDGVERFPELETLSFEYAVRDLDFAELHHPSLRRVETTDRSIDRIHGVGALELEISPYAGMPPITTSS